MYLEGSERLHNKASLSKTRKASQYQTFGCALKSEYSENNRKSPRKMLILEACSRNIIWLYQSETPSGRFPKYVPTFFRYSHFTNSSERLHVRNLYLFGKPTNYHCVRAVEGQMPKSARRNIETLFQKTGNISQMPQRNILILPKCF